MIEIEQGDDGHWTGEIAALPGVLANGATMEEAKVRTAALVLRVIVDQVEDDEPAPVETAVTV